MQIIYERLSQIHPVFKEKFGIDVHTSAALYVFHYRAGIKAMKVQEGFYVQA